MDQKSELSMDNIEYEICKDGSNRSAYDRQAACNHYEQLTGKTAPRLDNFNYSIIVPSLLIIVLCIVLFYVLRHKIFSKKR